MPRSPRNEAVREAASEWVARRDAGFSAAEEREFQRWRDADPRHAEALARYETLWSRLDRPRARGASSALSRDLTALRRRDRRRRAGWAAAATVSLLAILAVWSPLRPRAHAPSSTATIPLAILVPERRELADGTIVEYPAGTEIAVDFSSPEFRRVTLIRGEAHFQVAKNPARPFVVSATGVHVQAVGTAFSVQLGTAAVEVLVTEGRVAVDARGPEESASRAFAPGTGPSAKSTLVDAGQKMSLTLDPRASIARAAPEKLSPAEIAQRLGWRNPRMEFSDAPLDDVVAAINRYAAERGGARFAIEDRAIGTKRLSGIFRVDDPSAFLAILEKGFGIEAERRGERAIVLRDSR